MRQLLSACLVAAVLALPGVARAAILIDSATCAATSQSSTLTFSHTIGGGRDRLLVVCIAVEEDVFDADVSTVTYNGVAMINAVDRTVGSTTDLNVEIWYMLDASLPPAGSYDVVITCLDIVGTSDILASAVSVTGAAQAGPEATAANDDGETAATSISTSITTLTNEAWIFECVGSGDPHPGFTPDNGQRERCDVVGASARMAASIEEKATAGAETQGWSMSYSARSALVLAAFAPAATAVAPTPATINYRSIGTNSAVLYDTGDASINAGTSTVTFGGGATLPSNVGAGDKLSIGSGSWSDDFTDNDINGWTDVGIDSLNETGGELRTSGSDTSDSHYTVDAGAAWTDYTVSCDVRADDDDYQGISFRIQDANNFYVFWHNFGDAGAGRWHVYLQKVVGGTRSDLVADYDNQGAALGQIDSEGVYYNFKVVLSGTNIKCYIDNVLKFDFDDATYSQGTVGVWCESHAGRWDNMLVTGVAGGSSEFYVLSRDSDTQATVQETAASTLTNETYTIERAYNKMQAWEDAVDGDLVADDRREVGVVYNDGAFTDQLVISGSTTDSGRYLRLTVAEGARHDGTKNSGAVIDAQGGWSDGDAITVEDEYTRIEWLEIKAIQDKGDGIYFSSSPAGDNGLVANVFTHSFWQDSPNAGVNVDAADVTIRNCFMTGGSSNGILIGAAGSATVENCTIRGNPGSGSGVWTSAGSVGIVNTISVDHDTGHDFYVETAGSATLTYFGHNMYDRIGGGFDPANYQGGNQTPPADLEDLFVTAASDADLHLETSGHSALDTGLDISASSGFNADIDGAQVSGATPGPARVPGAWDIGADEAYPFVVHHRYRSIGTNAGTLYSTGTATIEPGSSVVTFAGGAGLPANVGVGDELVIGSSTYYLLARDSATRARVQLPPSFYGHFGESYTISRAYNTLQAWADGTDQNHSVDRLITEGVAYDDGSPFTAGVTVQNGLTIAGRYRKLTVAEGHRHNGTAGSGVMLDVTPGTGGSVVVINEDSFVLEWLEIVGVQDGKYVVDIQTGSDDGTYQNLLIHDFGVTDSGRAMHVDGTGTTIRNVMIWDGMRHGIWVNDNADATIENCTVYGMNYHGINVRPLGAATIRNTIAVNNGVATFAADFNLQPGDATYFGYNMWQEATSFDPEACGGCVGNNWAPPDNLDSLFISITPGSEDLHLETAGNRAINRGLDLSGTFTDDGDGDSRVMSWDIGADEALGGPYMPRVIHWTEVSPY